MTTEEVSDYIIKELLKHEVVIQKYNSMTTSSIYLKFDCGIGNTLRISDHKGNPKYSQMFRLHLNKKHKGCIVTKNKTTIYNYSSSSIDELISHIISNRDKKLKMAGSYENYRELMKIQYYKWINSNNRFWKLSTFISNKTLGKGSKS